MPNTRQSPRTLQLRAYTQFKQTELTVVLARIGDAFLLNGTAVELSVRHRNSAQIIHRKKIANMATAIGRPYKFDMSKVPVGCAVLDARAFDAFGQQMSVELIQDTMPAEVPDWFASRTGITRKVPKPWTPLTIDKSDKQKLSIGCALRDYGFAAGTILDSVCAADADILAAPVRFFGVVNGKSLRLRGDKIRVLSADRDTIELEQQLIGQGLKISMRTRIEFDGVIRYDWSVTGTRATQVDSLGVEIAVHQRYAEYLYHFPGLWGMAKNSGNRPDEPVLMGFRPYVWLGDDRRGLAWFCESDRNWYPPANGLVTEITPKGNRVLLRLHVISQPVRLRPASEKPAEWISTPELEAAATRDAAVDDRAIDLFGAQHYTFGMQATPVKPLEQDAWDYRITHIGTSVTGHEKPLELAPAKLDRFVEAGVRTVIIHEQWTDIEGHWIPTNEKQVRKIVKDCHSRGLKILLYYSFLVSDLAPEWRDFGITNLVLPKRGYPLYHEPPQPDQSAWCVCLNDAWQDFTVDAIARTMDQFGVDGVYLDGTEYPFGCCNTLHGCGNVKAGGTISQSFPIFGVRSAMRRLYNAVRDRCPDAQVNVHNSTCMVMPTLAWATSYWDGEQFQAVKGMDTAADLLPLDTFRAEFMGHQWGVPGEFLCYGAGFSFEQAWSICLLHDIPMRPNDVGKKVDLTGRIWKAMTAFDRKGAEWLPYWRNQKHVASITAGGYVSLYRHPKNGVLAVVSNLNRKRTQIELKLKLRALGLAGKEMQITDAITGRKAKLDNTLPAFGWRLLRLR